MKMKFLKHKLPAVGAILALGLGFATGVQAKILVIDDFNIAPPPIICPATPAVPNNPSCPAPISGINNVMMFTGDIVLGTPAIRPGWERTLSAQLDSPDSVEAQICPACQAGHYVGDPGGSTGIVDFTYTMLSGGTSVDLTKAKNIKFKYAADLDGAIVKISFGTGASTVLVVDTSSEFPTGLPNTTSADIIVNGRVVEIPLLSTDTAVLANVESVKIEIDGREVPNLDFTIDQVEVDLPPPPNGGHYVCYKSFGHFLREEVNLVDQFDDVNFQVLKPKMFCNPAMKPVRDFDQGIENTEAHLLSYKIKKAHREPRHVRKNVLMEDQFGVVEVQTFKPDRLMVPSGKSLDGTVPADPNNVINHFKCYKVRVVSDFQQIAVNVADQFTDPDLDLSHPLADDVNPVGKDLVLVRPTRMCTPVSKNGEGIIVDPDADPDVPQRDHLMCYSVKAGLGSRLNKRTEVLSNNQFGAEDLVLKRELEFCAPASKTVLD